MSERQNGEATPPSQASVDERIDRAIRWVASEEGRSAIGADLKRARTMALEFSKAQRINPEVLNRPVTR